MNQLKSTESAALKLIVKLTFLMQEGKGPVVGVFLVYFWHLKS